MKSLHYSCAPGRLRLFRWMRKAVPLTMDGIRPGIAREQVAQGWSGLGGRRDRTGASVAVRRPVLGAWIAPTWSRTAPSTEGMLYAGTQVHLE